MKTPTKEQIDIVSYEMWRIGYFAKKQDKLYGGSKNYWDNLMSVNMKSRLRQKAKIAITEWEKIRNSPK